MLRSFTNSRISSPVCCRYVSTTGATAASSSVGMMSSSSVSLILQNNNNSNDAVLFNARRFFAMNPETMKAQMKKNRSGFGDIDPERLTQFEDMQTGIAKATIEKKRKEREEFMALPKEEQIRKFMLQQRKFDVDLVRRNNMNVQEEYKNFKDTVKKLDRKANRSFWIPLIAATVIIWGGSGYWVFWWY